MAGGQNFFSPPIDTTFLDYRPNGLINANFDFNQRGITQNIAASGLTYVSDMWFVNSRSTSTWRAFQVQGTSFQGYNALELISTGAGGASGVELYQPIENLDTMQYFYNQTASLSVKVMALGNINQMSAQFVYATSEVKPTSLTIGSAASVACNTTSISTIAINGQALGTSFAPSGIIGIKIFPSAVSSGNISDSNNGFFVSQPYLTRTPYAITNEFNRRYLHASTELVACQRSYEKSYDTGTPIGTSTLVGAYTTTGVTATAGNNFGHYLTYKVTKRSPLQTITFFQANGSSGLFGSGVGITATNIGMNGCAISILAGTATPGVAGGHYVADASI